MCRTTKNTYVGEMGIVSLLPKKPGAQVDVYRQVCLERCNVECSEVTYGDQLWVHGSDVGQMALASQSHPKIRISPLKSLKTAINPGLVLECLGSIHFTVGSLIDAVK